MGIMDVFKRKREIELPLPSEFAPGPSARTELPSDLEPFRMTSPYPTPPPPEPAFRPITPVAPPAPTDKLDLIISKLETIDARLRVLEEKIERKTSPPGPGPLF